MPTHKRKPLKDGSAHAEETYRRIQWQMKLHEKILDCIKYPDDPNDREKRAKVKEERFLYHTGVKEFPDLESEENQEVPTFNPRCC